MADRLKRQQPDESFFYASGRSSNEAGFLLAALRPALRHQLRQQLLVLLPPGQRRRASAGRWAPARPPSRSKTSKHADLFFLIGGNPASNHPRLMRTLMQIRRNGGQVIVINPVKEVGLVNFRVPSDVRSLLLRLARSPACTSSRTSAATSRLLTGVAKLLLERNALDSSSSPMRPKASTSFAARSRRPTGASIEHASGVTARRSSRSPTCTPAAKNAVFGWTMGITHHTHGVANVRMIANLALLRGMVGRPHAGLLPIRGHSNVQGIGSVGVRPQPQAGDSRPARIAPGSQAAHAARPGHDGLHGGGRRRAVKSAVCLGGNLFGSNPDAAFAGRALGNLELVAYLSTTLNTGHVWGRGRETLILPVPARDEEGPTTQESMFNYVRLSDGGPARLRRAADRSVDHRRAGRPRPRRRSPVDWNAMQRALQHPPDDGQSHAGLRVARRPSTRRSRNFRSPGRTFHDRAILHAERQGPVRRRSDPGCRRQSRISCG